MGKLMNDQAENVLDALFSGATLDTPATWDVGLSTTEPADDATNITEPAGDAYARVTTNADTTDWPLCDPGSRQKANGIVVDFPEATADWGDCGHFVLFDPSGTPRAWGRLSSVVSIVTGVQASFDVGALVITAPGT